MNKYITWILLLITLGLASLAIYFAYLIFFTSSSVSKIDKSKQVIQEPTWSAPEEDRPTIIPEVTDAGIEIIEFRTDKNTYGSYERIELTLKLKAEEEIEAAEIRITGVKPYQVAYLRETKIVNIKKGENSIIIPAQAPSCTSGCGGVYPGPYDIEAEIFSRNELVARTTTTINLVAD